MTTNDISSTDTTEIIYTRKDDYFYLNINYESGKVKTTYKCHLTDKFNDVLKKFADKINLDYPDIYFLYNANYFHIDESIQNFSEIMNEADKVKKEMNILAYKSPTITAKNANVKIQLEIENKNPISLNGKKNEALKEIFTRNINKIGISNLNSFVFKYGQDEINLNKNFDDIANNSDRMSLNIKILSQHKLNPPFNSSSFCKRYKYYIILVSIIIAIIIAIILFFALKSDAGSIKYEDQNILDSDIDINGQRCSVEGCQKCDDNPNSDLCLDCGDLIPIMQNGKIKQCLKCEEEGYFVPYNGTTCEKCSINGCKKCEGTINNNKCLECSTLSPIKRNGEIIQCYPCSSGYFIPDESSNCELCSINGCKQCRGPLEDIECLDCGDLIPIKQNGKIKQCLKCDEGYFLPDESSTCEKCSINGCKQCKGPLENIECIDCGDLTPVYEKGKIIECIKLCETGIEEKCLTCNKTLNKCSSCNIGYKLVNGECKPDFFIKAVYYINVEGYWALFNYNNYKSYNSIKRLILDGQDITISEKYYLEIGEHILYIKFKMVTGTENSYFFGGNKFLKSVIFSNFNEYFSQYIPDINFPSMFQNCENLISVDFSKMAYSIRGPIRYIFQNCINLVYVNFNLKYKFEATLSAERMFYNCSSLVSVDLSGLYPYDVTSLNDLFYGCKSLVSLDLSMIDVTKITTFQNMFYGCKSLQNINLNNWKLDSANDISYMFYNCNSLKYLDLSSFKPPSLTNMKMTFYNCYSLTSINLTKFYTSTVTDMSYLFYNCSLLKILDISSFYTIAVTTMRGMFKQCSSLTSLILGDNFVTNSVKDIAGIFLDCNSLASLNIKKFDTSKVSYFQEMFRNCYNLKEIDISNFIFKPYSYLHQMFSGCYSLTSVNFKNELIEIYNYTGLLYNCPNLKYANISFISSNSYYYPIFNSNISDSGEIILNNDFYTKKFKASNIPNGWNYLSYP